MRRLNSFNFTTHKEVADWYDNKFTEMGGSWYVPAEEIDGLLDRLGVGKPPWKLLELGCGDGKLLLRAILRGGTVDGVDISDVARDMARAKLDYLNIDPRYAPYGIYPYPMEDLGFADGEYDFVITYGSMEHSLDIPQAVKEMARVLKSGGRFLNYAPNEEWLHEDQPLETTMTANEWLALYEDAGLQIESVTKNGDNTIYVGYKP